MASEYHIAILIKTLTGFETCGEFFVGRSSVEANHLFSNLRGRVIEIQEGILILELRTISRGLPIDVQMLSCTLDELGENCKTITKYLFTQLYVPDL
jgi:hypothetical protein